ncbi:MAG: FG-GAP-like repeat-containing protein [Bacteroidota bacterium]|nr:FG-GAP-like repeat-containing protein [Bacteroidota bacterium]MDP4233452.1 FG-GAP-like repeat-containing protein [Bacteroidota bacterium]MDP4242318.1 FG-GAP-like repeat-containing protein [Bacteroidota bacterium]MDP4287074.1 FG-GAP-like repeat-containing protein [Bacteroidota bacterium]
MRIVLSFLFALLAAGCLRAQVCTVKHDGGIYSGHDATGGHPLWEESVMLQPKGPCKVVLLYLYLFGTTPVQDTIWLAGDASEGLTPPSHYVWDHNLLTDPIVFTTNGKTGWDTIDISDRNVRSDGYDRIVVQHRLRTGGPALCIARGGLTKPVASFLYDPWTPNSGFYNIPGILYLPSGDYMARLGVRYDYPAGDSSQAPPPATLVDVATQVGLASGSAHVLADRVSVADWNGDGWDDIAIGSMFFQNKGDGTFQDVSSKINIAASSTVWGDFDNDGLIDCYAINGGTGDKLFKNNGDGTFTDVTAHSALMNPYPTVTPIWFDYDHDGWLDLYIANGRSVDAQGNETYHPQKLWHNNQNGTFTDVSDDAQITNGDPDPYYDCWGAAPGDYDRDGWPDIFVATYRLAPDLLFHNLHDGSFEEVGAATGVQGTETVVPNYFGHGIGCDWGDFNNDGLPDLAVGNLGHPDQRGQYSNPSLIFKNGGGPDFQFTDMHQQMGLKFREMNAGIIWLDLNNDGYLDLWHCQYSYNDVGDTVGLPLIEQYRPSRMYLNEGPDSNFRLKDVTWQLGSLIHGSWTAARGDFNHDGRMDIVAASGKKSQGVKLFQNNIAGAGNWIEVRLKGDPVHKVPMDAYGTSITVWAHGMQIYRDLMGGGSGTTGTQNTNMYHFGLGSATVVDSLVIRYPNSRRRTMYDVAANQLYTIPYDESKNAVLLGLQGAVLQVGEVTTSSSAASVSITMPSTAHSLTLRILDVLGHVLAVSIHSEALSGPQFLRLASPLASGIYFLQAETEHGSVSRKFSVLR